jgi:uncharacterized protein YbjT (DUF2867 family)
MTQAILVIGGTGMLGEPVARRLQADGHQVRILSRVPDKARARFGTEFEIVKGDVDELTSLVAAMRGCQGVHLNLQGGFDYDLERRGAENVSRVAVGSGVQRITYTSGGSVCEANCWYAGTRAKFQAETALQACGVPYTIFRDNYFMETLHNFVRGRLALHIGKHPTPYSWIAADDYARMVAKAYTLPEAANKVLYVCGPEALTMRQALQIFCRVAHPEARLVHLSIRTATIIAKLGKRHELQAALPFFRYCEVVKFQEYPAEANALLGAPTTTLEMWSRQQAQRNSMPVNSQITGMQGRMAQH